MKDDLEKQIGLRYDCIAIASELRKITSDGNLIHLSPEEIVEAATKFFNFSMTANKET